MKPFRHGLVVGKFYPPHQGHAFLVRSAAAFCDDVTVAVLAASVESIPLELRVGWMREQFADARNVHIEGGIDDHPVDFDDADVWDAHDAVFDQVLSQSGVAARVDATFCSETYGAELARRRVAANVCLDLDRSAFPVSATAVRRDPLSYWDYLAPGPRAYLAKRVVVVGAESTGTTTLSRELAAALRARGGAHAATQCVPEYGREYSYAKLAVARAAGASGMTDLVWTTEEFALIAKQQCADEEGAARAGGPVLVCDTDALATSVWHERYVGGSSTAVVEIAAAMPPRTLYVLTSHEGVPFEDDGLRDGEAVRGWMTDRFREVLREQAAPWIEVSGTCGQRVGRSLEAIDQGLADGWHLADPLG